ncbi:MAG: polysaccharide pyruvyl transferase family protein, partial [Muribaculaceae bacterium]|nr:polysaccharide pyruvyl transferase family protein [Muribaculaceae bacterium]
SDFDWNYLLDFTDSKNKISYAGSFGPRKPSIEKERLLRQLSRFKNLSVRESGAAEFIEQNSSLKCQVVPDPTLLLSAGTWGNLAGEKPLLSSPYIFVYAPHFRRGLIDFALKLSEKTGLPLVLTNRVSLKEQLRLRLKGKVIYRMDAGPAEFLNLIRNASYVVSGSFHAIVFSLIFGVPFFALGGHKDNRMKEILTKARCIDRIVDGEHPEMYDKIINEAGSMPQFDKIIEPDVTAAIEYLKSALDIDS